MRPYRKILIIKPSSLGDVVHSLPFLSVIKQTFPDASIHWVIAKGLETLLEGHSLIERLWIIHKDRWKITKHLFSTISEIVRLASSLRKERYDLVIDLQGLFRSGMIAALTGSPVKIGFEEAREGSKYFYTRRITGGHNIHAVERYLKIAESLGCSVNIIEFPFVAVDDQAVLKRFALSPSKYVVFIPGARWDTKRWPADFFGEVASRIDLQVAIIGGKADVDLSKEIENRSPRTVISLAGKTTLAELVPVLANARFVLTNDTGPMHIAAALDRTVISLFGPTDPIKTGPYGKGHIVLKANAPCAPCFSRKCKDPYCMRSISVDTVLQTVNSVLKNEKPYINKSA